MSAFPVELEIPVRFRDIDGMGHVNNAVFHTYLESARLAYWSRLGGGDHLEDVSFILARMECDFRGQIPFGGAVKVRIRCPGIGTKSFELDYRVESPGGATLYAEARSVQVCYDYARDETVPVSDDLRRRIATLEGWQAV